ncbi:MAG: AmmeMemoRadiSam system protein A [Lentisphaerae bacterium]|nr:AmmeMemoRadiSam system protein A [Lentisphaerota bacterium]
MSVVFAAVLIALAAGAAVGGEAAGQALASARVEEGGMRKITETRSGDWSPGLTPDEQRDLLDMARDSLRWALSGDGKPFDFGKYNLTVNLKKEAAVFVTYLNRGVLRGCIGILEARDPMYRAVHEFAVHASRDSRFSMDPITPMEEPQIDIHVSILSPMRSIRTIEEFRIGEHGICMEKGRYRAVYLPEVAKEQGWDRKETLSSLSRKAGLASNAWESGARFQVFSSVVIMEE